MLVLKFGGAALADSKCIDISIRYITDVCEKKVIVVSALKDVTDMLVDLADNSISAGKSKATGTLTAIREKHKTVICDLIGDIVIQNGALEYLSKTCNEIRSICKSISVLGECTPKTYDNVVSRGEKLSSYILAAILLDRGIKAVQVRGEQLILTDDAFGEAYPDYKTTAEKSARILNGHIDSDCIPVVAGFTGATIKNETTTLGRGGTDFSAAIVAYALDAEEVWFMKDVDGILSADPKIVKNSKLLPEISSYEAAELAVLGAKVLHPVAIGPLRMKNIPSYVKNVFSPERTGTRIYPTNGTTAPKVKALTYSREISRLTLACSSEKIIPSTLGSLISTFAENNIDIKMISYSGPDKNINLIIKSADSGKAQKTIKLMLHDKFAGNSVEHVSIAGDFSIVSAVGSGIGNSPGIHSTVFTALDEKNIDIIHAAKSASDMNIAFLVDSKDVDSAINCIHDKLELGA